MTSTTNPSTDVGMTEQQSAEAKRYGRIELACAVGDKALDIVYLAVAAFLFAWPLDGWLETFPMLARFWSLRLAVLFLVVMAIHLVVSFPLAFYSGHVVEHRFQLSTQTFGRWLWRYLKRNLLAVAFSLIMVLGLYWLIWTTGRWWWAVAAAVFFLVSIVLGQLVPVLILPLFYRIEKLDVPELTERISKLAAGTGLSIDGVYRMDLSEETVKANAMFAGLGRTRRVLLGDTLLKDFTPEEIEVIFAHEIGHYVFRHIPKLIVGGLLFGAAGFFLCDRILAGVFALTQMASGGMGYADLPPAMLPFLLLILTLFGTLLEPLQNAVSRRFERQADRYALERIGLKDAYLSAFRKLARLNKDDPNPHWLDVLLFHSHPPVAERLAMAESVLGNRRP